MLTFRKPDFKATEPTFRKYLADVSCEESFNPVFPVSARIARLSSVRKIPRSALDHSLYHQPTRQVNVSNLAKALVDDSCRANRHHNISQSFDVGRGWPGLSDVCARTSTCPASTSFTPCISKGCAFFFAMRIAVAALMTCGESQAIRKPRMSIAATLVSSWPRKCFADLGYCAGWTCSS